MKQEEKLARLLMITGGHKRVPERLDAGNSQHTHFMRQASELLKSVQFIPKEPKKYIVDCKKPSHVMAYVGDDKPIWTLEEWWSLGVLPEKIAVFPVRELFP